MSIGAERRLGPHLQMETGAELLSGEGSTSWLNSSFADAAAGGGASFSSAGSSAPTRAASRVGLHLPCFLLHVSAALCLAQCRALQPKCI